MQKRPLSYTLTTPISSLPSPLLGPGACHHPSPVSPHPVTDPSLYSDHNASPPLVRSTDVSARPHARPLPSRPKSGPLFGLAHSHTHAASPGTSAPNTHTQARKHSCRHTQGPFSTGTLGRGCHGDNRPTLIPSPSDSESERETEIKKWYYSKCGMCECAFPSHSWHSRRRWWNEAHTIAPHTHTHIHNTLLMHPAPALGLKALHDLLNKRLEQQVIGGTVRSVTNVVLYVHTDV